jgi:hypothetical protein
MLGFAQHLVIPITSRVAPGQLVFHVLNGGVGRVRLFRDHDNYVAFERVLMETLEIQPMETSPGSGLTFVLQAKLYPMSSIVWLVVATRFLTALPMPGFRSRSGHG